MSNAHWTEAAFWLAVCAGVMYLVVLPVLAFLVRDARRKFLEKKERLRKSEEAIASSTAFLTRRAFDRAERASIKKANGGKDD